jgi:uncharacterized membrane protein required for colicin V production
VDKANLNGFDLLVLALIAFGVYRGRKRGISEELLDLVKWLAIVILGALLYEPAGSLFVKSAGFSPFVSNVLAYVIIAILIALGFAVIKRAVGEKLVQSDAFGRLEYYLGMLGGAVRYLCILILGLSLLHAKYISDAERAATAKMQADNFGSISFPTIGSLQQSIFYESSSGKYLRKHLKMVLMKPAEAGGKRGETIGQRRTRAFEEVIK